MTEYIHTHKKKSKPGGLVFVVDDDPIMRAAVSEYLSDQGFKVQPIADGLDALMLIEKQPPRLIVSDIRMEKCDGITLLRGLQNRLETRNIPVIFISAYADDEILEQAKSLGASHFLIKPFPLKSLHQFIASLLGD